MENKLAIFDLLEKKIENFQRKRENLSGVEEGAEKILVNKLIKILQDGQKEAEQLKIPEEKAMRNSVVVREILRYFDARNLLKFREVSRLWKEESTSHLLSKRHEQFFQVKFKWHTHLDNFCQKTNTLAEFMDDCLQHSAVFPVSHFSFDGGWLEDLTLVQFFTEFGRHVRHLTLSTQNIGKIAIEDILFKWAPNLKTLVLKSNLSDLAQGQKAKGPERPSLFQSVILPKLTKIVLPKTNPFQTPQGRDLISKILTSAPNLTWIEDPFLTYAPQIIAAGKCSLLKSITWNFFYLPTDLWEQKFLELAATSPQPQLTQLILEQHFKTSSLTSDLNYAPALGSIFHWGQNTLEVVKGIEILGRISNPAFQLPPLPRVTQLKIQRRLHSGPNILPINSTLAQVLPNLKSIHFEVHDHFGPFSSPLNAHKSLQALKISTFVAKVNKDTKTDFLQPGILQVMGRMGLYPNITHLHIAIYDSGVENVPECFKIIPLYFKELEQTFIEIQTADDEHFGDRLKRKMDQALTGFPRDVCDRLELQSKGQFVEEFQKLGVFEQTRTQSSILDLKKLTNLTFKIQGHFARGAKSMPLWTHVAQFYAYQPMAKKTRTQSQYYILVAQKPRNLHPPTEKPQNEPYFS